MGCSARVWDNGDTTDCGREVFRVGLCSRHLHEEADSLRESIRNHEAAIREARTRLGELQTESG